MRTHLVTLFDDGYISRALALYDSAKAHIPNCAFSFLCLDNDTKALVDKLSLEQVSSFTVEQLKNPELEKVRNERSRGEFAFTAKSNFLAYLITSSNLKDGDVIIWADADILFYSSAASLVDEIKKHSIIRTPHKFPASKEHLNDKVGRYNAGMVFFTIDGNSRACIADWARQCIEWCYHRLEDGKLGDQMYLDAWHTKYSGVYDLPDKGVNAGTWNINNYSVKKKVDGEFTLDGEPLVCYHFHGFKFYESHSGKIRPYPICVYHAEIYKEYTVALESAYTLIRKFSPKFTAGFFDRLSSLRHMKQYLQKKILN